MVFGIVVEAIVRAWVDCRWQLSWKGLGVAGLLLVRVERANLLSFIICGISSLGDMQGPNGGEIGGRPRALLHKKALCV